MLEALVDESSNEDKLGSQKAQFCKSLHQAFNKDPCEPPV